MAYSHVQFVIALTGEKAAGKGEVACMLADIGGFSVFRFSDPIRVAHVLSHRNPEAEPTPEALAEETAQFIQKSLERGRKASELFTAEEYAASLGIPAPQTVNLQDMGNRWRARFGSGVFTDVLLRASALLGARRVIIDGFRNPGELSPLEQHLAKRWIAAGVVADIAVRQERFLEKRRRVGDPVREEDFLKLDRRDKGEGEPPDGQQVAQCLARISPSDVVENNLSTSDLETRVAAWYHARIKPHLSNNI